MITNTGSTLKAITHKILHYLNLTIVVIILLFTTALSFLWLLNDRMASHREAMAAWASGAMNQPIAIGAVTLSRYGIEPVVQFHEVRVFNDPKTKVLVKIKKLEIGIDLLASLLKRKIMPGFLAIDNTTFNIIQVDGHLHMQGVSENGLTNVSEFADMVEWLFTQGQVRAKNITVNWQPQNGESRSFTNLTLRLSNDILGSAFELASAVDNPDKSRGKFKIDLRLHGNVAKKEITSVTGKLRGENLQLIAKNAVSGLMIPFLPKKAQIEFAGINIGFNWLLPIATKWQSLFKKPVNFAQINGKFIWENSAATTEIKLHNLVASNPWLYLQSNLAFIIPAAPNADTLLNFSGFYQLNDFTKAKLYYPRAVMDPDLVAWLDAAFLSGNLHGSFSLVGPPSKFPFDNNEGVFRLDGKFNDVALLYNSNWPKLEQMHGGLLFQNRTMKIVADTVDILGAKSATSTVTIADLEKPVLEVTGKVAADSQVGQQFIRSCPLRNTMSRFVKNTELSGPMQLELGIKLPLSQNNPEKMAVKGVLTLSDNQLRIKSWKSWIKKLNGKINFTEEEVAAPRLTAELYDYPTTIEVKTVNVGQQTNAVNFKVKGNIAVQSLQSEFNFPFADYLSGIAGYEAEVHVYNNPRFTDTLEIASDLIGVTVALPKPFAKIPATPFPTKLKYSLGDNLSRLLQLTYGDLFTATEQIDTNGNGSQWLVKVANKNFNGNVTIPKDFSKGKISGKFSRVYIEKSKYDLKELHPKKLPALEFKIKDFRYLGMKLGAAELTAVNIGNGLKIAKLKFIADHLTINGTGKWVEERGQEKSTLQGKFVTPDLGSLLRDWDLTGVVVGGKTSIDFAFSWPGAFYDLSLKNSHGPFTIKAVDGRIIHLSKETEANLGFGRVLGLLSLQNLPRRLTFDFSDLTKSGFVFDLMQGDCQLSQGNIFSDNFLLEGPVAAVKVKGRIGLIPKDYDIELGTAANLTSSFPVIAALTGGPLAGLATFVAHKFVSSQAGKVTNYTYHVTGPWSNPKVQDIVH